MHASPVWLPEQPEPERQRQERRWRRLAEQRPGRSLSAPDRWRAALRRGPAGGDERSRHPHRLLHPDRRRKSGALPLARRGADHLPPGLAEDQLDRLVTLVAGRTHTLMSPAPRPQAGDLAAVGSTSCSSTPQPTRGNRGPPPSSRDSGWPGVRGRPARSGGTPRRRPAVGVVGRVPLALIAAAFADGHAGFRQRPRDLGGVFGQAAEDLTGGDADVGAVEAQPDASDHQVGFELGQPGQHRRVEVQPRATDAGVLVLVRRAAGSRAAAELGLALVEVFFELDPLPTARTCGRVCGWNRCIDDGCARG